MAPPSSTFAQKILWMEEPGRLQSMGSLEQDMTKRLHFHFSLSYIGEGNGNPLQCSCLENPRVGEAWWAAVYGVTQSRTRLKQLSSSSSSNPLLRIQSISSFIYWSFGGFLFVFFEDIFIQQIHPLYLFCIKSVLFFFISSTSNTVLAYNISFMSLVEQERSSRGMGHMYTYG